jgi:hypothetical protein
VPEIARLMALAVVASWGLDPRAGLPDVGQRLVKDADPDEVLPSNDAAVAFSQGVPSSSGSGRVLLPNRGQWNPEIAYAAVTGGSRVVIGPDGMTLQRLVPEREPRTSPGSPSERLVAVRGWNVGLRFAGGQPSVTFEEQGFQPGEYNFLLGRDPAGWATHVTGFSRLVAHDVYPGIDAVYRVSEAGFKYDLALRPYADLDAVRIAISGDQGWWIDADGSLVIRTGLGECRQPRPVAFEASGDISSAQAVEVTYRRIDEHTFGFSATHRDPRRMLLIDPEVIYSTLVGGMGPESIYASAAMSGSCWIVGSTYSFTDYPTTPGAFQTTGSTPVEGVITCLASDGESLVWSTFLGGTSLGDEVLGIDIASDGAAVVAGYTYGPSDFPVTQASFDPTPNGESDGFVARLTLDGSGLTYSTLIGGGLDEYCGSVRLDDIDNAYVTGTTKSADFPTTPGAFLETYPGSESGYVAQVSADGSALTYSTLIAALKLPKALAIDTAGGAYVTGWAGGNTVFPLPVTAGAFDTSWNGLVDAFVCKVNPGGASLGYCTYLGGSDWEEGRDIDVDDAGNAYITGKTISFDFPTTPGAFDTTQAGSQEHDTFVTKLDPTGSRLVFSTHLGGTQSEEARGVRVGSDGSVFAVGQTLSGEFPVTPDAWQSTKLGDGDAYLVRFDPTGSFVTYGTFIGGSIIFAEDARALALDENDNAFCVGVTNSADFPTTPGAFDSTLDGFNDAFVVRVRFSPWELVGAGLSGTGGLVPALAGAGSLEPGSEGSLKLSAALPSAGGVLVLGLNEFSASFKGGTLVPEPLLLLPLFTDGNGEIELAWLAWPAGVPVGTEVYFQAWITDPGGPKGYAASQGLRAVMP